MWCTSRRVKGEPVLLLHGYPQSASCWRHQIPALAENHRVIAADWPGFGRAEPPGTPPTYDDEVERIGGLADSFGLDRFNLMRTTTAASSALATCSATRSA